ncbi:MULTISPECIES: type I-U CRISPR-associated helicase/endonuclease Cas3 [Arthrobacter]|uniref:Type I-U CRISPR-associated helicase/endonuclease Cas3 n=2 Tax=Arthrobacter TaxID=1663 RepID=A0ABU9KQQ8_9MICC|nr:type I-U CRISPR-associated helicase/endonuclease Cas3 [Arthrobacter sp. YJM1]MDP5228474.1 type I-U CRISPR-associated helicase/endonuclease Cas3 [Arthrobacter sp. YJM1]
MNDWGIAEFRDFYQSLYPDGRKLYRWQERLAASVLETGEWPGAIEVPTGLGKTFTVILAAFATAASRNAPTRIVYVVDRRTVVDAAYQEALRLQEALRQALSGHGSDGVLRQVAVALQRRAGLFGELRQGDVLHVSRLHGAAPRDRDWRRSPVTPTILLGTVDQIGSRLLHRGYGVSERTRSLEAGLLGMDALLLLDEPHLSVPFLQTLRAIDLYQQGTPDGPRRKLWAGTDRSLRTVVLGATLPRSEVVTCESAFQLTPDDLAEPRVHELLSVRKDFRIVKPRKGLHTDEVKAAVGRGATRLAVMVNTVSSARNVYDELQESSEAGRLWNVELLVGRARPLDREHTDQRVLDAAGPGAPTALPTPVVVVSTQTLEVGADLSFDFLITEAAPWPNLVQRAGRLIRRAEHGSGEMVVVDVKDVHPAYGDATATTTAALRQWQASSPQAHLGYLGIAQAIRDGVVDGACHPPAVAAPILLWEHLATWLQTCPAPVVDMPVVPFLHGSADIADDVRLVWRQGLPPGQENEGAVRAIMTALPVRDGEELEISVAAARAFLQRARWAHSPEVFDDVSSGAVPITQPEKQQPRRYWVQMGNGWVWQSGPIGPGARVLVDAAEGGLLLREPKGLIGAGLAWKPSASAEVPDLGDGEGNDSVHRVRLGSLAAQASRDGWAGGRSLAELVEAVSKEFAGQAFDPDLGEWARREELLKERALALLDDAGVSGAQERGTDGVILTRIPGTGDQAFEWVLSWGQAREPGARGTVESAEQGLREHSRDVMRMVEDGAHELRPEFLRALQTAAAWHDHGKARAGWQWSVGNYDPNTILAKSGGTARRTNRSGYSTLPGVEPGWRHEALSAARLEQAGGDALAIHLVGSHHGEGRPFYRMTLDHAENHVPAYGQAARFHRLVNEHGPWGLAYLEAVLRLSDWAVSAAPRGTPVASRSVQSVPEFGDAWPETVLSDDSPQAAAAAPRQRETVLRGLDAGNLADYCTAVGLLRALARRDSGATLRWKAGSAVIADDGGSSRGMLWDAMVRLGEFYAELEEKLGGTITAGRSGLPTEEFRRVVAPFAGLVADDVERWISGCHLEWVRLTSKPDHVAGNVAAIWTRGRSDPLSHIGKAVADFELVKDLRGRRAAQLSQLFEAVDHALQSSQGELHLLRSEAAKMFGMDYRSASYRAKADQDSGYIPFLVGMAHYGFNTVFRPRGRRRAVGVTVRSRIPSVHLWLNAQPLTLEALLDVHRVVPSSEWLGAGGLHLWATEQKVSEDVSYYRAAEPFVRSDQPGGRR